MTKGRWVEKQPSPDGRVTWENPGEEVIGIFKGADELTFGERKVKRGRIQTKEGEKPSLCQASLRDFLTGSRSEQSSKSGMKIMRRQGLVLVRNSESGSYSLKSQRLKTSLTSKTDEVWKLKFRIKEAQQRLKLIEDKLNNANGAEREAWQEAYPKVLGKMESLCSELQELIGWENTCPWGCEVCLKEKAPLEIFEEQGYLSLWSDILQSKIAFVKDWAKDKVPQGYIVYTEHELNKLFSKDLNKQTLRLIHEAKKYGAVVTEVKN